LTMAATLKRGAANTAKRVKGWQNDLADRHFYSGLIDGDYGEKTEAATKAFQESVGLPPTGEADDKTIAAMETLLGSGKAPEAEKAKEPAPVTGSPIPYLPNSEREKIFGHFNYKPQPGRGAPGCDIQVIVDPATGHNWATDNLLRVEVPQLRSIHVDSEDGPLHKGFITFHRMAAHQLQLLWAAWEAAGLLGHVLTFDGSYVARYVRGSTKNLSNHAYGTAFDINAEWNGLGSPVARRGQKGSVEELVPLAAAYGFYWGGFGWNTGRLDAMHFECAQVVGVTPGFKLP
jgi:hypothetical protein